MNLVQRLLAVLLILSAVSAGQAQTTTGEIFGYVTDASGAVLSGVTVRITNPGTGTGRETKTNNVGAYRLAGLIPANYVIVVEFPGFRSMTRSDVVLPIQ